VLFRSAKGPQEDIMKLFVLILAAFLASSLARKVSVPPPRVSVTSISSPAPVIGILTQDTDDSQNSYIYASYIKYLESAGARVVPVVWDQSPDDLTSIFSRLNGLLFPGGGINLLDFNTPYMQAILHLYNLVIDANTKGDYFPLWGTCMGFQEITVVSANTPSVLDIDSFDSENLPQALNFTSLAQSSRMFRNCPASLLHALSFEDITMNNHHDGVKPETYSTNAALSSIFNVLSTNSDRAGKEYVSAVEGKKMPIYGVQFHPEKNSFEWADTEDIPHSANAIALGQYLSMFFVDEARLNTHQFPYNDLMLRFGIWNFPVTYTYPQGNTSILQTYIFPRSTQVTNSSK